jgi:hypothetical protein
MSHGQLYVDVSRITCKDGLKILPVATHEHLEGYTPNVVYKEVFDRLYCVHVYVLFSVIKWLHSSHQCLSQQRTQRGYTLIDI